MTYDISYIILTWNSAAYIEACLASIINASKNYIYKIYIVDNGSRDTSLQVVEKTSQRELSMSIECIALSNNLGTTISRNLALKKACIDSKYICILDSDTVINQEAIDELLGQLKRDKQIGLIGPQLVTNQGGIQNSGRAIPTLFMKFCKGLPIKWIQNIGEVQERIPVDESASIYTVGYLMSACWMMPSWIVKQVGFLDEHIFYAPEDVEYCMRLWKAGYQVVYDRNVAIIHHWQRLSKKKLVSKHNWEHIKGLVYLFWKYKYCFKKPDYVQLGCIPQKR